VFRPASGVLQRESDVEDEEVELARQSELLGRLAVLGEHRDEAIRSQAPLQDRRDERVVLRDQDSGQSGPSLGW
jgi:hypothetical protein